MYVIYSRTKLKQNIMEKLITKVWEPVYENERPVFEFRPLTREDFDCEINFWEDIEYGQKVGFRATVTLKEELVKELEEVISFELRPVYQFGRKVSFDYRGCRTEGQKKNAVERAKKKLSDIYANIRIDNEGYDTVEDFYKDMAITKFTESLESTRKRRFQDYESSFIRAFSRESSWNFDEKELGLDSVNKEIEQLQARIDELVQTKHDVKLQEVKKYMHEQGENRFNDKDVPETVYKKFAEMVENGEIFSRRGKLFIP